ncbi:tRNA adenosine(34) deaminase TadA [Lacticaseibacillus nasuensis]|uniref:tRNA-specific adenosine deaminase n=1 Tax=Lacticaseibacillus nasuensis JCM 17158 TaxID=1291734 RepID=A0A0R1JH29_9LACO|nr:tRNA adenosine(34) deaminase TadA [Lacticaseibacillus nasuensis]KRK70380.1 nucleoside deaminase [Lacticaseibacillus nasuensis JCM 17158]
MDREQIEDYMGLALAEARDAAVIGEVPIGAVVVHAGQVIGRGHNLREHAQDSTLHAEIMAIQEACMTLHTWRLEDCDLFVTLEPCPMCAGAMINSRLRTCYFGAPDPKAGMAGTLGNLLTDARFNHQVQVVAGVRQDEAAALLQDFFRGIRAKRKANRARQTPLKRV